MKRGRLLPKYTTEINELAEEHFEALLALYADAFHDGRKVGQRNTLLFMGIGIAAVSIWSCIACFTYREYKEKQT